MSRNCREKHLSEKQQIFTIMDTFQGVYFIKTGIIHERYGQQVVNKAIGDILGLRTLVNYMNLKINRNEVSDSSAETFCYLTTAEAIQESFVFFIEKDDVIEMIFKNEDLFDSVYKMYYQHHVLQTNVGQSDLGHQRHRGNTEFKGQVPQAQHCLRYAQR